MRLLSLDFPTSALPLSFASDGSDTVIAFHPTQSIGSSIDLTLHFLFSEGRKNEA
jgi:hypothetical protein